MPFQKKSPRRCLRAGITGGIGSGKTTVCRIFEALGVPVYDADYRAKGLIQNDPSIRKSLVDIFGPEAYLPGGVYNRTFISEIVFRDPAKLAALNAAVHPALEKDSLDWHREKAGEGYPYTLKEAAILVESGGYRLLDALIVVTAPEDVRIRRVVARDGLQAADVRARIRNQLPEKEKIKLADFLIINDGRRLLLPQVWAVHQKLLALR